MLSIYVKGLKPIAGVVESRQMILGYQDAPIELMIYEPLAIEEMAPCLIYFHGGAFAIQAAPHHKNIANKYALHTPCKVVFVDYRLAPKYPYPVGIEDGYAAFTWVYAHAQQLHIDPNRIALGGDSAGGAIAIAVQLMARDRMGPKACFQLLVYPVTDARQITPSMALYQDTPVWNSRLNRRMWQLYLKNGVPLKREYASPMEADTLVGIAPTYLEVAEFDCLRDEGIGFAKRLEESGVPVTLIETQGTLHGFEVAETSEIVKQSVLRRIEALKIGFQIQK